jgi:3-hydroxybutyryl-CoA dehydratase
LIARVTVKAINPEKKLVTMDTVCSVANKPVIEGEATVMVPARG